MERIQHNYSTEVGQLLIIWITGMSELYIAEIIKEDPLWLKVEESGPRAKLKPGDYIVKQYYSAQWQSGEEAATKLLRQAAEIGNPFLSGLKKLGIKDDQLHHILPA